MASGFRQSGNFEPEIIPGAEDDSGRWTHGTQLPSLDPRRRVSHPLQQLPPIAALSSGRSEDLEVRKAPSIFISTAPSAWSDDPVYSPSQASGSSATSHYGAGSYGSWEASPIAGHIGHSYSDSALDIRTGGHVEDPNSPSPRVRYPLQTPTSSTLTGQQTFSDSLGISGESPSLGDSGTAGSTPQAGPSKESSSTATRAKSDSKPSVSPKEGSSSRSDKKSSASTSPNDLLSIDSLAADDSSSKGKRRGKLPREVTEYLKDWLMKHAEHPYPTEEEKKDMCRHTGLHMTQLSNWFINARRRILAPNRSLRGYQSPMSASGSNQPSSVSSARPAHAQGYSHGPTYSPSQYSTFSEPPYPSRPHYGPPLSHQEPSNFAQAQPLPSSLPRSQSFAGVPTYGPQLYYPSHSMPAASHQPYSAMGGAGGVMPGDPSPTTSPPGSVGSGPMHYTGQGSLPQSHGLRIPGDMNVPILYSPHSQGPPRYYGRDDPSDYNNNSHPK
ncbi:hypothetical protein CALVIDRAFT_527237 [Calocera viscosa TUFC12733]|uniref:Homeobox domain-containing protein n=1 Tax=Calocera viscosa (strain TUFC12733) TaxID=1330018 RepID=A0A167MQQ9_CALVF|nr:hypothetical protein CALVIDRAFT_527237 [Calocera viscosa TUFC12733]